MTEWMDGMDGRHGAWLAKQFECLDDRKKRNRWDAMKAVSQKRLEVERFALADYCKVIVLVILITIILLTRKGAVGFSAMANYTSIILFFYILE